MSHDEHAIREVENRFAEAWSGGDAGALAALFTEDALRVGARGDTQRGRAEIRAAYERMFQGPFAGAGVTVRDGWSRMLGSDFALWHCAIEIAPPGRPVLAGYGVDLLERRDGRWWIAEAHPRLFPPPFA